MKIINVSVLLFKNFGKHLYIGKSDGMHIRYETWRKRRNSSRWPWGRGRAAFLTEHLCKDQVVLYSLEPQPKVVQILKDKAYVQIQCSLYREFSPSCVFFFFLFFFFSLFFFHLFFISWRLIILQYCSGFSIHWHESAMDLHVFPIPILPPASLPIPSLWVFPVHQPWALVSCIQPGLVICFTLDSILVSILFSLNIPLSPSPTESQSLFCTSVSLFLFCILDYLTNTLPSVSWMKYCMSNGL